MKLFRIMNAFVLVAVFAATVERNLASAQSTGRGERQVLSELDAAALPKVDVVATADPRYVESFSRQRDAVRQKRAGLILELYTASPHSAGMQMLLAERWQTLVQQKQVEMAIGEMSAFLATDAPAQEKEAVAFQRAQTTVQQQTVNTTARLAAIEQFKLYAGPANTKTMVAQLLYWTAKLEPDSKVKDQLLARVTSEYPDSQAAKVITGTTRRQDAIGKTMTMSFSDAITGTPIDIADFRGKVVVVDFWAAWCTDCAAEMPHMKKVYSDFKDKGVVFIGVSLDLPEADGGLAALKDAVARHQIKWPQYYLGREWDSDFSTKWGVYSVPAVFVVDVQGKVINTDAGPKLELVLNDMLKARSIAP
jgi:thiol-disulfide isomerase/thioredoxin